MEWNYDGKPTAPGWYAVLICYDPQEGIFPAGEYWDGSAWKQKAIIAFCERRETQEAARELAYQHDPEA